MGGRCVVHSGKRRHGASAIKNGERSSLILWAKSDSFRWTAEYQQRWGGISKKERDLPDIICLSETRDWDYDHMSQKLRGTREHSAPLTNVKHPSVTTTGGHCFLYLLGRTRRFSHAHARG